MKKYFIPLDIPGRINWLTNFTAKLPAYATKYNIPAAAIADLVTGLGVLKWINDYLTVADPALSKAKQYRRQLLDGVPEGATKITPPVTVTLTPAPAGAATLDMDVLARAASIAGAIKSHKDYSPAEGTDMGIEGQEIGAKSSSDMKPVITVAIVNGRPTIFWTKNGMQGIKVYMKEGDGEWTYLGTDTIAPDFTDKTALPKAGTSVLRSYKVIYFIDEEEAVGEWSDIVTIAVSGV